MNRRRDSAWLFFNKFNQRVVGTNCQMTIKMRSRREKEKDAIGEYIHTQRMEKAAWSKLNEIILIWFISTRIVQSSGTPALILFQKKALWINNWSTRNTRCTYPFKRKNDDKIDSNRSRRQSFIRLKKKEIICRKSGYLQNRKHSVITWSWYKINSKCSTVSTESDGFMVSNREYRQRPVNSLCGGIYQCPTNIAEEKKSKTALVRLSWTIS